MGPILVSALYFIFKFSLNSTSTGNEKCQLILKKEEGNLQVMGRLLLKDVLLLVFQNKEWSQLNEMQTTKSMLIWEFKLFLNVFIISNILNVIKATFDRFIEILSILTLNNY